MPSALVQPVFARMHMQYHILQRAPQYRLSLTVLLMMASTLTIPWVMLIVMTAETTPAVAEGPKNRYEKLENKISRLCPAISLDI